MTLQAQCHLYGWRSGVFAVLVSAQQCVCLGQNTGVVVRVAFDGFNDFFDAVAGVFELCVERFVMAVAMILQAL